MYLSKNKSQTFPAGTACLRFFFFFGYCQTEKEQSLSLLFYSNSKTVVLGGEQKVGNHSIRKLFEMQAVPSRMVEDQHKKFLK